MHYIFYNYVLIQNKIFTSNFFLYFLVFNILFSLYLFFLVNSAFFKILINFLLIINVSMIISFLNVDFFSALLLSAELPIILITLIFYFHKNSLQIDNVYKYKKKIKIYFILLVSFLLFVLSKKYSLNFVYYNFLINNAFYAFNKNDFLTIFYTMYFLNNSFIVLFAILIFFVSILVIFVYQLNKLFFFKITLLKKNNLILKKQNLLKQSNHTSKLKFYNKKI